jgi:hypothetical protein
MIARMTGYKATDKDLKCQGYQFKLGEWHGHAGELVMCKSGFHFCKYPSGPYCFYPIGSRVFKVEAEEILDEPETPGADLKLVARRIRLVEEITPGGDRNTGDGNTGHRNTGHWNTGHWNTGDRNTGDGNTGHWNTGDWNTGHRNTGDRNTGDWNTGHWNTGHWNTGDWNTGDGNTGDWNTGDGNTGHRNTGDRNTGDGNTGDYHAGLFNKNPEPLIIFDLPTAVDRDSLPSSIIRELSRLLGLDERFDYKNSLWLEIPNATPERIELLHEAHILARANKEKGQ